jgi:hypothetical protein
VLERGNRDFLGEHNQPQILFPYPIVRQKLIYQNTFQLSEGLHGLPQNMAKTGLYRQKFVTIWLKGLGHEIKIGFLWYGLIGLGMNKFQQILIFF